MDHLPHGYASPTNEIIFLNLFAFKQGLKENFEPYDHLHSSRVLAEKLEALDLITKKIH